MTGLSIACAKASGGEESGDGDGDGDTTLPTTGGGTGSGGLVLGTSGGAPSTSGGMGGLIVGAGGTPVVTCMEGDMLACASVVGNTALPVGMAACNADGDGWDISTCTECEPETGTIDCALITDGAQTYTGGTATCDVDGNWDESTCEWCGDGAINGTEDCEDGDVPEQTCEGLELDPGAQGTTPLSCNVSTCAYDISDCGLCDAATYPGAKCIEGPSCGSSSACSDAQCAAMNTCDFNCSYDQDCTGMSCNRDATCTFSCPGVALCTYECLAGSTCTGEEGYDDEVEATCEAGATCSIACPGLAAAAGKTCTVNCESGANCSVTGGHNSEPEGTAFCSSGTCDYEFETGRAVPLAITCEGSATCNISSTYQGSISDIACDDTSTCNIMCGEAATCSYTCAAGATCTRTGAGCTEV